MAKATTKAKTPRPRKEYADEDTMVLSARIPAGKVKAIKEKTGLNTSGAIELAIRVFCGEDEETVKGEVSARSGSNKAAITLLTKAFTKLGMSEEDARAKALEMANQPEGFSL